MRTKLFSWVLLLSVTLMFVASGQAAQTRTAGKIVAAKVRGTVTAFNKADNSTKALRDSDTLSEGYVVTTAQKSSVVLLFANGSAVNLSADSTLSIDEFLMDPFDAKYAVAEAKEEPSTSTTKLSLQRGEFVGNVKHLHRDQGSTYSINTPVGAAGIRGTTFVMALTVTADGKVMFTLGTAEGLVGFTDLLSAQLDIPAGKAVEVSFEIYSNDPQGRTGVMPESIHISGIKDLTAEQQAAIARAMQEILDSNASRLDPSRSPNAIPPPVETTPGDGRSGG